MPVNKPTGLIARGVLTSALSQTLKLEESKIAFNGAVKSLLGIEAIYDTTTSMAWLVPVLTGEVISFIPPLLTMTTGTHDLTQYNVERGNFKPRPQSTFAAGFTVRTGLEVFNYGGIEYRFSGSFPLQVPAGSFPGDGWLPIALEVTPAVSLFDGSADNTALLQRLLDTGRKVKLTSDHRVVQTAPLIYRVSGCGIIGSATTIKIANTLLSNPVWHRVEAEDVEISGVVMDYSYGNCYAGIRTYPGARRFLSTEVTHKNVYGKEVLGGQSVNCLWLETYNCEGFKVDSQHFENILCLGNVTEGDSEGSITGILLRQYQDLPQGGWIGKVTATNVNTVDALGNILVEDADLIKSQGFSYVPVVIDSVIASDVGKRVIKAQAKGMTVRFIDYQHNLTTPHRAVVDHQDSDNHVVFCTANGNIASLYRTTSPTASRAIERCSFKGGVVTTYIADTTPASAIGVIDISSGRDLEVTATVNGGLLGVRLNVTDAEGVLKSTLNLNITSNYAFLARNIYGSGIIDNVTVNGKLKSLADNAAPGVHTFITNSGVIGTLIMNAEIESLGSYSPAIRFNTMYKVVMEGVSTQSSQTTMELTSVTCPMISNLSEKNTTKAYPVIRIQGASSGNISKVTGGKPTGTSIGLVAVYGCSNLKLSDINNINTGRDITFHDNDLTTCTGLTVDFNTQKVTAPTTYNDSNVVWAGYPSYVPTASLVNIVKRGSTARDTTTNSNKFWNGTAWV